jgi:hypothetical protein
MTELIEYTGDGNNERPSEFHDLDLDEIGSAACEALKAACEARTKWIEGRDEWIQETLRLARLLVEGRQRFPSNDAFGKWIDSIKGLSLLSHQDRAALIQLGKWPAITRDVLEKTRRNSWREIWDKEAKRVIEPSGGSRTRRLTSAGKTAEANEAHAHVTEYDDGEHPYIFPEDKVQLIDALLGNNEGDGSVRDHFIDEAIEAKLNGRLIDVENDNAENIVQAIIDYTTGRNWLKALEIAEEITRRYHEKYPPEPEKPKKHRGRPKGSKKAKEAVSSNGTKS